MSIWQPRDFRQRIKFRGINVPNMITVSNIADSKAVLQKAAMSTTGYAYAAARDEDPIQFDFICGNHWMSNNKLKEDRKLLRLHFECLRANPPIILNKTLTIDGINTPGLTING